MEQIRHAAVLASTSVLALIFSVTGPVGPAQAAPAPEPTSKYVSTTSLPDPSEALAVDRSTGTVYAMTEAEDDDEGGVDTDAVTVASDPGCGEDQHDIAVINGNTGEVQGFIPVSGEAEYMAVDPALQLLYVPQYNDEGLDAPQCLAVVDLTNWAVAYYPIPFTFVDPRTGQDTGYQYNPTGVDVDPNTHIAYLAAKMPEIEEQSEGEPEVEWGQGAIMAFDGANRAFLNTFVPAGDDPESLVFNRKGGKFGRVYAANEDEGTITVTSAITLGSDGLWDTRAFRGSTSTFGPIFDASECPAGTYQPAEADKLAVNDRTNMVYLTDDRFRVAAIPGDAKDLTELTILRLTPDKTCPTSSDPEVYNYANNLALDPALGSVINRNGGKGGLLYVTSENSKVSIVDLGLFTKVGEFSVSDAGGPAKHIDWPVISPTTNPHRFFVTDEQRAAVYIYDVGDRAGQTGR